MFLRPLKTEQKKLFLGLAEKAVSAKIVLKESEKQLLAAYADEMDIALADASDLQLDALCKELKRISSLKELKQITFEIIGMLLNDSVSDADNQVVLSKVTATFEISEKTIEKMEKCIRDYRVLIGRINRLMLS